MKNLVLITGANSELAKPYVKYFESTKADIIATFQERQIKSTECITPVRLDLQDSWGTRSTLMKVLNQKDITEYDKIFLLHLVGKFFYEGLSMQKEVMEVTYKSNVMTFDNIYGVLQQCALKKKSVGRLPDITLFNIGSISDKKLNPWPSYSLAKNILRNKFYNEIQYSKSYGKLNINSLFINAGTIDIEKERILRPYADQEYWMSPKDVFDVSIEKLINAKGCQELTLYKNHPEYHEKYEDETLVETHNRRVKEMGVNKGRYVPNLIQGIRNPNTDITKNTVYSLFRHYYINRTGDPFLSIHNFIENKNLSSAINITKEAYECIVYTPKQLLEFCKTYGILPKDELALFKKKVKEADMLLADYIYTRKENLSFILEKIDTITAEEVNDIAGVVGAKFDAFVGCFKNK